MALEQNLTPEKLADGNILLSAKERFQDDMSEENLMDLMQVLRDSVLLMPMRVIMSAADEERMRLYEEDMKLVVEDDVQVIPATAPIEDMKCMLIFSQAEQIPVDYSDAVTIMRAPWAKVQEYLENDRTIDTVVLDPFTENLELPRELVSAISMMDSRLTYE